MAGAGALSLNTTAAEVVLYTTIDYGTGAAIELLQGTLAITDSIITSYTIGISNTGGTAQQGNNLFFGNVADTQGAITNGGGDVTDEPLYKSPATGNYHLRPTSPAQNIGVDVGVATDVDGDLRPFGGGFDAGYDEYINHAPAAGGAAYGTPEETVLHVTAPRAAADRLRCRRRPVHGGAGRRALDRHAGAEHEWGLHLYTACQF